MTERRPLASEGMERVQNSLSCRRRHVCAKLPLCTAIQLTVFFFQCCPPHSAGESVVYCEVVALRAGWTCWPRAADSYRNTKSNLIGWESLYPEKSMPGVAVFCAHKRLFESCHFSWNRGGLSETEGNSAHSLEKKVLNQIVIVCFGYFFFPILASSLLLTNYMFLTCME